ncbi:hypothetical protein NW762_014158 [Fusarium torreyae]|uniref:Uncharacterized protein n=1 Tax=Fusarium torreyae TaxID=1237075 RepID=A0A9W8RJF7_9HYPO|nr:hypothetical protein NW762_014158 [Fusarium torreyae]
MSQSRTEFGWVTSCVADIEDLIPRLGMRTRSPGSPAPPGTIRLQEKLHRRSKHAFAPEDEEEEDPAINPPESGGDGLPEEVIEPSAPGNAPGEGIWSFSLPNEDQNLAESTFDSFSSLEYPMMNHDLICSSDMGFGEQDIGFPLDPFDLQLNAYTDANVPNY